MDASYEEGVVRYTRNIYKEFEETIRLRDKSEIPFRFWDVVVLTASDDDQKEAYELQLRSKLDRREIPTGVDYIVFSDPPGPKIGCGGATMHVVTRLTDIYGSRLSELYVLLINAGGMSQRLPSASVLGKIFTALPTGRSPPWQLLELKLAAYVPLLARMNPGYLHVASDTIEVYDVGEDESLDWSLSNPGLTALAHRSSIYIGTTHGVFVLDPDQKNSSMSRAMEVCKCVEVLQKPTVEVLRSKDAVLKTGDQEEFVYTDSLFYFDHAFGNKLLEFYKQEYPLQCELDAYGDFMQSLGNNATSNFVYDTRNVLKASKHLVATRLRLFNCLKGNRLNVVAANASKFFHLGTVSEYLDCFSTGSELANFCGFGAVTFCHLHSDSSLNNGCLINCVFTKPIAVGSRSIVEYCRFECSLDIGDNCVISNCCFDESKSSIKIPSSVFLHTVPVRIEKMIKYVTLAYHITDNVKAEVTDFSSNFGSALTFLGKPLSESIADNVSLNMLFACDNSGDRVCSLWYARLFPVLDSMAESFSAALDLAKGQLVVELGENCPFTFMSASEVVINKDVHEMLRYRDELYQLIKG